MAKNTLSLTVPEFRMSDSPTYLDLWTMHKDNGKEIYRYIDNFGEYHEGTDKGVFKTISIARLQPYVLNFDSNNKKDVTFAKFVMSIPRVRDADGITRKKVGSISTAMPIMGRLTLDRATENCHVIQTRSQVTSHFLPLSLKDKVMVALKYGQNIEGLSHTRIIELMCDPGYDLVFPPKSRENDGIVEKPIMVARGIFWQGANAVEYIRIMKAGLKTFEKEITIQKGIISGDIEYKASTGYSFGGQYVGNDHLALNKSFADHPELFMLLQNQVANKNFQNEDDLKDVDAVGFEEIKPTVAEKTEPIQEAKVPEFNLSNNSNDTGFEEIMTPKSKSNKAKETVV